MEWHDFTAWAFPALITAFAAVITACFIYGLGLLKELQQTVAALNTNVALLIQSNSSLEKRVEKLEDII